MTSLRAAVGISIVIVFALLGMRAVSARVAASSPAVPAPIATSTGDGTAVLAGGCYWGVEAVFRHVKGVKSAVSGFTDGAESVRIVYDPEQVSYGTLLRIFFSVVHDPTQLNRQGPDRGPQYRSAIFYVSPEQKAVAESYIAQLAAARVFSDSIVTQVAPFTTFNPVGPDQQNYARKNPRAPYIVINDAPKIAALHREFPQLWRDPPL